MILQEVKRSFLVIMKDKDESIYGFLRLRKPSKDAHREEIG